jgi:hypothetical protein
MHSQYCTFDAPWGRELFIESNVAGATTISFWIKNTESPLSLTPSGLFAPRLDFYSSVNPWRVLFSLEAQTMAEAGYNAVELTYYDLCITGPLIDGATTNYYEQLTIASTTFVTDEWNFVAIRSSRDDGFFGINPHFEPPNQEIQGAACTLYFFRDHVANRSTRLVARSELCT